MSFIYPKVRCTLLSLRCDSEIGGVDVTKDSFINILPRKGSSYVVLYLYTGVPYNDFLAES